MRLLRTVDAGGDDGTLRLSREGWGDTLIDRAAVASLWLVCDAIDRLVRQGARSIQSSSAQFRPVPPCCVPFCPVLSCHILSVLSRTIPSCPVLSRPSVPPRPTELYSTSSRPPGLPGAPQPDEAGKIRTEYEKCHLLFRPTRPIPPLCSAETDGALFNVVPSARTAGYTTARREPVEAVSAIDPDRKYVVCRRAGGACENGAPRGAVFRRMRPQRRSRRVSP